MTLSGLFRFNSRNQIIAYNVNFLRFPEFLANLYGDILLNNKTQTFLDLYGPPSVNTATAVCQYAVRHCEHNSDVMCTAVCTRIRFV